MTVEIISNIGFGIFRHSVSLIRPMLCHYCDKWKLCRKYGAKHTFVLFTLVQALKQSLLTHFKEANQSEAVLMLWKTSNYEHSFKSMDHISLYGVKPKMNCQLISSFWQIMIIFYTSDKTARIPSSNVFICFIHWSIQLLQSFSRINTNYEVVCYMWHSILRLGCNVLIKANPNVLLCFSH